jgi:hypothetical protein
MINEYAVFAERELRLRADYAYVSRVINDMPYDELRWRRDVLIDIGSTIYPYFNAEIARRHSGNGDVRSHHKQDQY